MIKWQYGKDNEVLEIVSRDGKPILTRSTSQDASTETIVLTNGPTYELRRDASGHPTTLLIDGVTAAQASWRPNGTLAELSDGTTEVRPRRHKNGWPNGVFISAPAKSGKTTQWLEEEWDMMGRPTKITDSSGFEYRLGYDEQGRLRSFGRLTEDGNLLGAKLHYDSDGLVTGIEKETIAGHKLRLVVVTFDNDRMTLRVPTDKMDSSGLRKVSPKKTMDEAITTLKGKAKVKRTMWSRRAQEYEAKINSGDPIFIAEVVRDLHRNVGQPDQSFSERQIYEVALERLVGEFAAVDGVDKEKATEKLETVLNPQ